MLNTNPIKKKKKNLVQFKFTWNIQSLIHLFKLLTSYSVRNIAKCTCIWKFVQRQSPHLGCRCRHPRILSGYQAMIFNFSFFNVSHKSLRLIIWNLIEYLHIQDPQRATAHLNVWRNFLLFCFVYGCKQHKKIS